MTTRVGALGLFAMLLAPPVLAIDADGPPDDPQQAALYDELIHEVRCLVCQNQTIGDSTAPLAGDLRREIRRMVVEGQSEDEIKGFLLDRYGDFVLYEPRFGGTTALLWAAPALFLAAGGVWLARTIGRRRSLPTERDADEPGDGTA